MKFNSINTYQIINSLLGKTPLVHNLVQGKAIDNINLHYCICAALFMCIMRAQPFQLMCASRLQISQ